MSAMDGVTETWDGFDLDATLTRLSFNKPQRQRFYSQLRAFISQGLPPYQTIKKVVEVADDRLETDEGIRGALQRISNGMSGPKRQLASRKKIMVNVVASMDRGAELSEALRPWVPVEEAELLRTGERSGRMIQTLNELERMLDVKTKISKTMISNAFSALLKFGVLFGMMHYIIGTVLKEARGLVSDDLYDKMTLAPAYFAMGELFQNYFLKAIVALIVLGIVITVSLPRWRPGGIRQFLDTHVPPYNLYSQLQSSFLLVSASAMMESGRQFREALDGVSANARPWMKTHTRRMIRRLEHGQTDADAMQTGMLPWDVEDTMRVYAQTGDFNKVMRATSHEAQEILLRKVQMIGNLLNIVAMMSLGLFVIFTIFSIGEIALEAQSAISSSTPK